MDCGGNINFLVDGLVVFRDRQCRVKAVPVTKQCGNKRMSQKSASLRPSRRRKIAPHEEFGKREKA
jgi:hypothetical protein